MAENAKKLTYGTSPILVDYATNDSQGNNIVDTYAKKSELPTSLSQLSNDTGFITTSALDGYATQTYVQQNPKYTITVSGDTLTIKENY